MINQFSNVGTGKIYGSRQMFSHQEDMMLKNLVMKFGDQNWKAITKHMPCRTMRQCRDRYRNYLDPNIVNGPWTEEEDILLREKHKEFGPKWSFIVTYFSHRSDINVKNRWTLLTGSQKVKPKATLKNMSSNIKSIPLAENCETSQRECIYVVSKENDKKIDEYDAQVINIKFRDSFDETPEIHFADLNICNTNISCTFPNFGGDIW